MVPGIVILHKLHKKPIAETETPPHTSVEPTPSITSTETPTNPPPTEIPKPLNVILICWNGADRSSVNTLLEAHSLSNLEKLIRK